MPTSSLENPEIKNWPLWWFAQLQSALKRGDLDGAHHALGELARLGIEVRFLLPPEVRCDEYRGLHCSPAGSRLADALETPTPG
jgi:hypothetical protein